MARRRFDHDAALAYFVALGPERSLGKVARHVGVSETSIRRVARRDNWEQVAGDADRKTAERLLARSVRALEARNAETILVADRLRAAALAEDASIPVHVAIQALPAYAKLEQLFAGEATDRIDAGQVQQVLVIGVNVALRFVPAADRQAFLEAFQSEVSGQLEPSGEAAA